MNALLALATKDIRLLLRNRGALFFTMGWPLLVAVFFGLVFGGDSGSSRPKVALVVQEQDAATERFAQSLLSLDTLEVERVDAATAEQRVRQGKRSAAIVLPVGFGERSARAFSGDPPTIELWLDPSRKAERAMVEGMLMKLGGEAMFASINDPSARAQWLASSRADLDKLAPESRQRFGDFYDALDAMMTTPEVAGTDGDAAASTASGLTPLVVSAREITVAKRGPGNGFAVSFTQGMFWALLGALMSFVTSLVLERMQGTWNRLRSAPLSAGSILLGKALACFVVMCASLLLMSVVGAAVFGVVPHSVPMLLLAFASAAIAFTGLMMMLASLGRSVQTASGAAWAVMMPLAMVGGAMIPLFIMPPWMLQLSNLSPVKWAVIGIEGATWRGFSFAEMMTPVAILLATGVVCGGLGAWRITRQPN
ncbi:MAG TPA: ABC transporter permease [Patescibacteria group bacterium]|nr:ABC transporter permease [Patescibacteria group bacterium]